jgi:Ser/Thr protein kinase RdoA (MazF antagonist)
MMNSSQNAVLNESSIPLRLEDAGHVVTGEFGVVGRLERLGGERDDNFLVTTSSGERYLFKVAHPREDPQVTHLQSSVLLFLENTAPEIQVQRVIRSRDGEKDVLIEAGPLAGRRARLTTFLGGRLMRSVRTSSARRHQVGVHAAQLDRALSTFTHPATNRHLLWDLQRASDLRPLMCELTELSERDALLAALDRFERDVVPGMHARSTQVIHNDLSTDNLLVDEVDDGQVAGVLDFGDVVDAPVINELAVAASYQLSEVDDHVAAACDVARGFHSVTRLDDEELNILPGLITARVMTWVTIPTWRSVRHLGDPNYVLRNAARSRALFLALGEIRDEFFCQELRRTCHEGV